MDPPAFGHTPRGGIWRIDDQLEPLVADVLSLLPDPVFFLINHYAREADGRELARIVTPHLPLAARRPRGTRSTACCDLKTAARPSLDTGVYARWDAGASASTPVNHPTLPVTGERRLGDAKGERRRDARASDRR